MSERRGGPFDLFTVNDAKFYQRSLLVEDGLMGACAKTRGVTPNTWMKTCAPAVPARQPRRFRLGSSSHSDGAVGGAGGREQQADREAAAPAAEAAECVQRPPPRARKRRR